MKNLVGFLFIYLFLIFSVHAYDCDCSVFVYPSQTGSHDLGIHQIERYRLQTFSRLSHHHFKLCRKSCADEFYEKMGEDKLNLILIDHSQQLILDKKIGYNCSGASNFKYPIRVKASLGGFNIGNVVDIIKVVSVDCPQVLWD